MRKTLATSVTLLTGLLIGSGASAAPSICDVVTGNVVANCGFETGNFSSWALSGNLQGGAPPNNFFGVEHTSNSGLYGAYFGVQSGPNSVPPTPPNAIYPITLTQTLPLLPEEYYSVSFYLDQNGPTPGPNCPDPGCTNYFDAYFNGLQLYAVTDHANTNGYLHLQFTTATGMSGHNSDLLQFDFQNNDDWWFFDDVVVTPLGPVPEPASWLLVGPTLGGLLALLHRRRRSA